MVANSAPSIGVAGPMNAGLSRKPPPLFLESWNE
jgi:hypothetical protein